MLESILKRKKLGTNEEEKKKFGNRVNMYRKKNEWDYEGKQKFKNHRGRSIEEKKS